MARYGLIGRSLGHSFSQHYFTAKFKREGRSAARYDLFELAEVTELPDLIRNTPGLRGLNVTIPYKQTVVPLLTELDPVAAAVGAVNTIAIHADGRTTGHNTDVEGFRSTLQPLLERLSKRDTDIRPRALVLGNGGASRAVAYVLREAGIRFRIVSRDRTMGDLTWEQLDRTVVGVCPLIINATPLGTFPNVDEAPPLPYNAIGPDHLLIDLVYNPEETLFLKRGKEQGATTANGLTMLHEQAEAAWRIWEGE
ncbi:MAG: shikimate dehydrogenase [Flavobacteriales bacterium]|nr:shikimate dehydrogenase [Flavobacteriales bacterium]